MTMPMWTEPYRHVDLTFIYGIEGDGGAGVCLSCRTALYLVKKGKEQSYAWK